MRCASQIRIRLVGDDFAFASVVCNGWSVHGIKVRGGDRIEWPVSEGKNGAKYPIVTPPPGLRDQLEGEILAACDQAIARGRGR